MITVCIRNVRWSCVVKKWRSFLYRNVGRKVSLRHSHCHYISVKKKQHFGKPRNVGSKVKTIYLPKSLNVNFELHFGNDGVGCGGQGGGIDHFFFLHWPLKDKVWHLVEHITTVRATEDQSARAKILALLVQKYKYWHLRTPRPPPSRSSFEMPGSHRRPVPQVTYPLTSFYQNSWLIDLSRALRGKVSCWVSLFLIILKSELESGTLKSSRFKFQKWLQCDDRGACVYTWDVSS